MATEEVSERKRVCGCGHKLAAHDDGFCTRCLCSGGLSPAPEPAQERRVTPELWAAAREAAAAAEADRKAVREADARECSDAPVTTGEGEIERVNDYACRMDALAEQRLAEITRLTRELAEERAKGEAMRQDLVNAELALARERIRNRLPVTPPVRVSPEPAQVQVTAIHAAMYDLDDQLPCSNETCRCCEEIWPRVKRLRDLLYAIPIAPSDLMAQQEVERLRDKLDGLQAYRRDLVDTLNAISRLVGHPTSDADPDKLAAAIALLTLAREALLAREQMDTLTMDTRLRPTVSAATALCGVRHYGTDSPCLMDEGHTGSHESTLAVWQTAPELTDPHATLDAVLADPTSFEADNRHTDAIYLAAINRGSR